MKEVTLSKIIGETGVFVDGDWVESKDQDVNGDVRLIQLADIGDGFFINKSNRFLTSEKAKELKCTFLKQGDLLIARMPDPLGRACIFPGLNMPCVTVVDVCIVRPDTNIANSYWLKFLINSYDFRNKINKYITGTTRQRISRGNLEKLSFKLPEINVQNKIAFVLDKAESAVKQRKASIDLLTDFLQSTFLKLFGDALNNSKHFQKTIIKNAGNIVTGTTPPSKYEGMFGGDIPFITPGDLETDEPNKRFVTEEGAKNSRTVRAGTTFVCCIGATIGKVGRAKTLSTLNQQINAIEWNEDFNDLFGEMLMRFMKPFIVSRGSSSTTLPILNKGDFEKIEIIKPPLSLQNEFAKIVEKVETLKAQYQDSSKSLEKLFGSLNQKAMNGDLDLSSLVLKYEEEYSSTDNDREEPKPIDKEKIIVEIEKEEEPEDKRYGDPFEVDEATAKKQGKEFYKEWKRLHPKKAKSKLTWDRVSTEQAANWIKENYTGFHFTSEMLVRFLMDEHVTFPDYHSSEELKKNPKANDADDLKTLIFSALNNENPFLKLEQVFYNPEIDAINLTLRDEDFELIKNRTREERTGVYLRIAK